MQPGNRSTIASVRRVVLRGSAALLLAIAFAAWYLSTRGAPEWVLRIVRDRLQAGSYVFEAEAMRLDPKRGIILEDLRAFRQRVPGPAVIEAAEVILPLDVLAGLKGSPWVPTANVRDAVIRPALALSPRRVTDPARAGKRPLEVRLRVEDARIEGEAGELLYLEQLAVLIQHAPGGQTACRAVEAEVVNRADDIRGTIRGECVFDTRAGTMKGSVVTRIDPHALVPLFDDRGWTDLSAHIRCFDFGTTAPDIEFEFAGKPEEPDSVRLNGTVQFLECSYNGVELLRGDTRMDVRFLNALDVVVTFDPLFVVRPEGMARAVLTVNSEEETVEFSGESTINPHAMLGIIGILTNAEFRSALTFPEPVRVRAEGSAWYAYPGDATFEAEIKGRNIQVWRLSVDQVEMQMSMAGGTNRLDDIHGSAYGGSLVGWAEFMVPFTSDTNTFYTVCCELVEADFSRIVKALGATAGSDYKGWFSGSVAVAGLMGQGNARTAHGRGEILVEDGRIFMLPVFGGLSSTMTKIIPGLDFVLRQGEGRASFTIAEGKVRTEKLLVAGDVLSLLARGDYYLDEHVDFDVQVTLMKEGHVLQKLLRLLTYPISKLFEFRVQGALDAPQWKPVHFSSVLLEKLGLKREEGAKGKKEAAERDENRDAASSP